MWGLNKQWSWQRTAGALPAVVCSDGEWSKPSISSSVPACRSREPFSLGGRECNFTVKPLQARARKAELPAQIISLELLHQLIPGNGHVHQVGRARDRHVEFGFERLKLGSIDHGPGARHHPVKIELQNPLQRARPPHQATARIKIHIGSRPTVQVADGDDFQVRKIHYGICVSVRGSEVEELNSHTSQLDRTLVAECD